MSSEIDRSLFGIVFDDDSKGTHQNQDDAWNDKNWYARFLGKSKGKQAISLFNPEMLRKYDKGYRLYQALFVDDRTTFLKDCFGFTLNMIGAIPKMNWNDVEVVGDPYSFMSMEYGLCCDCCGVELTPLNKTHYSLCDKCNGGLPITPAQIELLSD